MQHQFGQYGTKRLAVERLLIQLTGTYNPQWSRPFEAQMNESVINAVSEQVASSRSATPALFSTGMAASMIMPSALPERPIIIPNGWGTERLRYVLQLKREDHAGTVQTITVSGFTDYADLSMGGNFDPRTRFYIDSVNVSNPVTHKTPHGVYESQRVVSANQLVVNRDFQPILSGLGGSAFSIAPDNVFTRLQSEDYSLGAPAGDLVDTRHHLTGTPQLMQRAHNSAPQYCSAIMDTWRNVTQASENNQSSTQVMDECSQMLRSSLAQENPFIEFLMRRAREDSYLATFDGAFSYADLIALDANTHHVTQMVPMMGGMHQVGQSAAWDGADQTTLSASTLAQSVPSYMTALGFTVFHFSASNNTMGSQIVVIPSNIKGFGNGMDQSRELEALCFRIKSEVLSSITFGNQLAFDLTMKVDVFGETVIDLSMNGQPATRYVAPTFADALAVPTVTIDENRLKGICHDIRSVFDNVWEKNVSTAGAPNLTGNIRI